MGIVPIQTINLNKALSPRRTSAENVLFQQQLGQPPRAPQTKPRWGSHASKTGGDGTQDSILDARRPKRGVRKGELMTDFPVDWIRKTRMVKQHVKCMYLV